MPTPFHPSDSGRRVVAPLWNDDDPYTMDAKLCDDDGVVRRGAMHHGTDYTCTGHAHFAGEHIRCISAGHPDGLPSAMLDALRDPGLLLDCPVCQAPAGTACGHGPNRERLALRAAIEGSK
jgi:hypothetical protein